jgi:hypothetical protein
MKRLILFNLILGVLLAMRVFAQTEEYPIIGNTPVMGNNPVDEKIDVMLQSGSDPCAQSANAATYEVVTAKNLSPILDWTAVSVTPECSTDPNATTGIVGQTILLPGKTVVIGSPWTIGTGRRVRGQQPGSTAAPVSVLQAGLSFPDGFGTNLPNVGGISTATGNNNGSLYTSGDILNVIEPGAFNGQVTVSASGGVVTGVTGYPSAGQGYQVTAGLSTTCSSCHNPGASGATINVTALTAATNGTGTGVSLSSSTASFYLGIVAASETWTENQFLRVYNANGGTVYYGTIASPTGSGTSVSLDPPATSNAASACPSSSPCSYMVETPMVILGSPKSAPTNATTFNSELSGVELDCNHVVGCLGWVDVPGQEGTTVTFVSVVNFTAGCGRIVAPNSGPYTILGCTGNTVDPVVDTLPLLVCTTPSASREIRDFSFTMANGQTTQPSVGVDVEATCAETDGTTTGGGQTLIEAGHIERVTKSYLIAQAGSPVNNVIVRHVNQANGTTPTQVLISNSASNTGNILLEGFTCGLMNAGTLINDQITSTTVTCNGSTGIGGSGKTGEDMGFYYLGEVPQSGFIRTRLSSFPGVFNQAQYMHTGASLLVSGANFTTTSSSLTTITGLSWSAPKMQVANVTWDCNVLYSVSTNSNVTFGYQTTTAPSNAAGWGLMYLNSGAGISPTVGTPVVANSATTAQTVVGPSTPAATAGTVLQAELHGGFESPSTSTPLTLNILASIASSNTLTIYRDGTSCHINF